MTTWTHVANQGQWLDGRGYITCMSVSGGLFANTRCKVDYVGYCDPQTFHQTPGGQQCFNGAKTSS